MAIYRITVQGLYAGQIIQNVIHFQAPDGAPAPAGALIDIRDFWLPNMRLQLTNSMTWNILTCATVSLNPPATATLPVLVQGALPANSTASPFDCMVIQFKTNLAGPRGHGRIYITGHANGHHLFGILTASVIGAWTANLQTLKNRYLAGGTGPMTIGLMKKGSTNSGDFIPLTDMVVRSNLGVQRRRNYGVGI